MYRRMIVFSLVALFLVCSSVQAEVRVDTNGLTEAQKATIVQQVEKLKEEATVAERASQFSPDKVNEWAELGKNIALAFTTVAKELGVAADQFLASTTGKITLVLIIWKVAGQDILGFTVGVVFLFAFVPLWIYFFRRLCLMKSVIAEPVEGHRWPKKTVEFFGKDIPEDIIVTRWVMLFVLVAIVIVGLVVAL